jgi:hypothetical protein
MEVNLKTKYMILGMTFNLPKLLVALWYSGDDNALLIGQVK